MASSSRGRRWVAGWEGGCMRAAAGALALGFACRSVSAAGFALKSALVVVAVGTCMCPQDPYVPGTCQELLKWKFAHMNSVDFRLRWHAAASAKQPGWAALELLETRKDRSRGYHALEGGQGLGGGVRRDECMCCEGRAQGYDGWPRVGYRLQRCGLPRPRVCSSACLLQVPRLSSQRARTRPSTTCASSSAPSTPTDRCGGGAPVQMGVGCAGGICAPRLGTFREHPCH